MLFPVRSVPATRVFARAGNALALIALLAPAVLLAASPGLTLEDATRLAAERAPMLAARNASVSAAREEAARADALPDPMLMLGIDNLPVTGRDAFEFAPDEMTMKRIGLRQEFPARAKREARRMFAVRKVEEARAVFATATLDVRRVAAEAWIDLWAAQLELAALEALKAQAVSAAALAKGRARGNAEPMAEVLAIQASVFEVDNRIEGARAACATARVALARWLGDDNVEVSTEAPGFRSLRVPESRLLTAVDRLGPLLPLGAQVATAAANIDLARAEKRVDWNVGASYGQREGSHSDMFTIEFGIALPLFGADRQDRGVAAREADLAAAIAIHDDSRREAIARIRSGVARWEGLKRQVALHETAMLPLARDRSAIALAAYRAGGGLQSWLDAQRAELDVHVSHAEHLGALGRAWTALAYLLPTEAQP